jgi:transcriptional regulator with XRE-family HTH domain
MKHSRASEVGSDFSKRLDERIQLSGLSDRDVATKAGISNGLLSMLRNARSKPTLKVCVLLAWALNTNPLSLYREILEFLITAGEDGQLQSVTELEVVMQAAPEDAVVWIYAPDSPDLLEPSNSVISRLRNRFKVTFFTRIDHARISWEAEQPQGPGWPSDSAAPNGLKRFVINTPPEDLLTHEGPLLVMQPDKEHYTRLYQWHPNLRGYPLLELPRNPTHTRFIKALFGEAMKMNVYELATFERDKARVGPIAVVVYTQTFPEMEQKYVEHLRLYESVKSNLKNNRVRYLYLNPELDKARTKFQFNNLRSRLKQDGVLVDDTRFKMIDDIDVDELLRKQTIVLYVMPPDNGDIHDPHVLALVSQVEGCPLRFEETDQSDIPRTHMNLVEHILTNPKVKEWLSMTPSQH